MSDNVLRVAELTIDCLFGPSGKRRADVCSTQLQ
jgi:hypothetical protein